MGKCDSGLIGWTRVFLVYIYTYGYEMGHTLVIQRNIFVAFIYLICFVYTSVDVNVSKDVLPFLVSQTLHKRLSFRYIYRVFLMGFKTVIWKWMN